MALKEGITQIYDRKPRLTMTQFMDLYTYDMKLWCIELILFMYLTKMVYIPDLFTITAPLCTETVRTNQPRMQLRERQKVVELNSSAKSFTNA